MAFCTVFLIEVCLNSIITTKWHSIGAIIYRKCFSLAERHPHYSQLPEVFKNTFQGHHVHHILQSITCGYGFFKGVQPQCFSMQICKEKQHIWALSCTGITY